MSGIAITDPVSTLVQAVDEAFDWRKAAEDGDTGTAVSSLAALPVIEYDRIREEAAQLLGCRIEVLDREVDRARRQQGDDNGERRSAADTLLALAGEAELFHDREGRTYADVVIAGHRETWPIDERGFGRWLRRRYHEATGRAAPAEAVRTVIATLVARASFDAPERSVFVRIGEHGGEIFLDLGDETWRAVAVGPSGWRVVENPPVRFRRPAGLRPLPVPARGGDVRRLRRSLNLDDRSFVLVVAWLLAVLRPRGPYPVLVLTGEQGTGKTNAALMLRSLVDPNAAPLRALPRDDRDLFIAARNAHLLAFDNISGMPGWLSDTLCRLATGGGFAVRQLYSDADEMLFDASRPLLLNGIEDVITRPDLADRAIFVTLEAIPEERRRPEAELRAAFEADRPKILGGLLDAVAEGLRRLPTVHLPRLPRMADFARWASACETAFAEEGTFVRAYDDNREGAVEQVIEADPVASAVRMLVGQRGEWSGTASELLDVLGDLVGERTRRAKGWPANPRALSGRLRRAATFLRQLGIDITFLKEGRERRRIVVIRRALPQAGEGAEFAPAASAPSAGAEKTNGDAAPAADAKGAAGTPVPSASLPPAPADTGCADADRILRAHRGGDGSQRPSAHNPLNGNGHSRCADGAGGADATLHPLRNGSDGTARPWADPTLDPEAW